MTFVTLLQILRSELEQYGRADLQDHGNGSGSVMLTAITRRVIPGLRNYSSWLLLNATILAAGIWDTSLKFQIIEMWKIYAGTLTLLVSSFPVSTLPLPMEYLLEEDEDTLGFKPFDSEHVQRRYVDEVTGQRKPKWHDKGVNRQHPNLEVLGRIRDFLTDGMILHTREVCP